MVLLAQIPVSELKEFPSVLWSSAIDGESQCVYEIEVIGSVKHFHEIIVVTASYFVKFFLTFFFLNSSL